MAYRVVVAARARADIGEAYSWILDLAPDGAAAWLDGLEACIASLSNNPRRCARAREDDYFEPHIRQLVFGRGRRAFRVFFTVEARVVYVLHVRRASREGFEEEVLRAIERGDFET